MPDFTNEARAILAEVQEDMRTDTADEANTIARGLQAAYERGLQAAYEREARKRGLTPT